MRSVDHLCGKGHRMRMRDATQMRFSVKGGNVSEMRIIDGRENEIRCLDAIIVRHF